ncbi:MAG TPA: serine hydrolase domain-containing protein [Actinomycetota bacterium]
MQLLDEAIETVARDSGFTGVVRVDRAGTTEFAKAYGLADRAHEIANSIHTRFALASGAKGFTALTVMSLVEEGSITLDTTARSLLGDDLPLIDDAVNVEHLLAHRSGIGDYLDESALDDKNDYVMPVPVQELSTTEQYLAVLDGHHTVSAPDERFAYNNGGFVVLALIAERVSGVPFHELVRRRVSDPAGMTDTAFLRSDELPGDAALGYLTVDGPRTNIFHLPVLGSGDGGIYSTAGDLSAFWAALFAARIVPSDRVAEMVRPRSDWPEESKRYGLGFHLHETTDVVWLEGSDAGVSFLSTHDPTRAITHTVISNLTDGAWPVVIRLDELLGT